MQYQVQEMLRVERIFEAEAIQEELDSYNPLIPDGSQLEGDVPARVPGRRRAPRAPRAAERRRGPLLGAGGGSRARVGDRGRRSGARERREDFVGALPALRAEPADVRAGEGGRGDRRRHRSRELSPAKWRSCRPTCATRSPRISLSLTRDLRVLESAPRNPGARDSRWLSHTPLPTSKYSAGSIRCAGDPACTRTPAARTISPTKSSTTRSTRRCPATPSASTWCCTRTARWKSRTTAAACRSTSIRKRKSAASS